MMSEISDKLTRRDKDVLHILWESEEAMTASQIVSAKKGLTMNTVQAVLRKLLKNELVEVDKIVYSGTVLSRSYRATTTEAEFELACFCGKFKNMKKRSSVSSIMVALLGMEGNRERTQEEIKELEDMLEKFKQEMLEEGVQ